MSVFLQNCRPTVVEFLQDGVFVRQPGFHQSYGLSETNKKHKVGLEDVDVWLSNTWLEHQWLDSFGGLDSDLDGFILSWVVIRLKLGLGRSWAALRENATPAPPTGFGFRTPALQDELQMQIILSHILGTLVTWVEWIWIRLWLDSDPSLVTETWT